MPPRKRDVSMEERLKCSHTGTHIGIYEQCDQMVKLFVHYLAIYCIKNLPNSIRECQSSYTICPILNKPSMK